MNTEETSTMFGVETNFSVLNSSMDELDRYKDMLSDESAMILLPAIVIFGAILIVGTVGNSLVLFVYFFKFKASFIRTAILTLAVFDLVTCVLCIPGEILDMRYSYTYTSDPLCKGQRLLTTAVQMASGFVLVCVANDRFRRICYPLRQQATAKEASKRMLLCCLTAVTLAIPAALVYGVARVPTPINDLEGMECSTSETFRRHPLRIAYNVVLCIVFVAAFTSMIVYYVLIGRKVLRQGQFRDLVQNRTRRDSAPGRWRRPTASAGESDGQQEISVADGLSTDDEQKQAAFSNNIKTNPKPQPTSPSTTANMSPDGKSAFKDRFRKLSFNGKALGNFISRRDSISGASSSLNSWRIRKTTFMLFIITLIFVVSFLPHLALKALQAGRSSLLEKLDPASAITYNVMVRSYFFNAAINWLIYGLCSPKFRSECRAICGGVRVASWTRQRRVSRTSDEGV